MSEATLETQSPIDSRVIRDVMGHYPTGVVVVTGVVEDEPVGMVVGTFSSVSLEPPLVSFMPMTTSNSYAKLRKADRLCISVLAADQLQECRTLASKDPKKFDKVAWTPSRDGVPMIDNAVAYVHGRLDKEMEAGDHYISLVAYDDVSVNRPVTPLLFFQGGYGGFSTTGLSAHVDESMISAVRIAEAARPQLDALAQRFQCSAHALVQISPIDQTIGATSYGGTSDADERIGVRIPLIPPLGEAAVAWSPEQVDQWVARIFPPEEEVIQKYRNLAEKIREQGYAVSRFDNDPSGYEELGYALAEYGSGELTPARDRAVRSTFAASSEFFGGGLDSTENNVNLASVVVPVFAPHGEELRNSGLVIRLGHLPQTVAGATALQWVEAMQEAAAEVQETLRTTAARDYARYVASGLR